jgi:hypothetical protein
MRESSSYKSQDRSAAQVLRGSPASGRAPQRKKAPHVTDLHVGFTGTRRGMTPEQQSAVAKLIFTIRRSSRAQLVAHHGDCIGSDATFYRLVMEDKADIGRWRVVCHPPTGNGFRAHLGGDEVREPIHPLMRNSVIVRESTLMIATPAEWTEQRRGGTWYTIRRSRMWERPLAIIWRDGSTTMERWK